MKMIDNHLGQKELEIEIIYIIDLEVLKIIANE
jgi:hypothetical protein